MRDERDIHVPILAALLERLRAHVGDGRGWCVEVGDMHTYGTAGEALTAAVGVSDAD